MKLTPAYTEICDIIKDESSIVSKQDLIDHLKTVELVYTSDDLEMAYSWSMQAIGRVIVHNFGEQALCPVNP